MFSVRSIFREGAAVKATGGAIRLTPGERTAMSGDMTSWRVLVALSALTGAAVAASGGMTWENSAAVGVTVNGHAFHDAHVEGRGCTLAFRILFDAPEWWYSDPRNKVRNYHLFRARVKFAKGWRTVRSKTFKEQWPNDAMYSFEKTSGNAGQGAES